MSAGRKEPNGEEGGRQGARIPHRDRELLQQCRVDTFRSGGPGGRHADTTDSAIRLTHLPTGIAVIARDGRSQQRNRELALERLRARLRQQRRKRKRRIATRVPKREKRKRLENKRKRSRKKRLRKPPAPDD